LGGGAGRVGLDTKTNRLIDYALQNDLDFSRFTRLTYTKNDLDFSRFTRLTYTKNEENHFDYRL